MQNIIKHTLYTFLCITGSTAAITLIGIMYSWFGNQEIELPYLKWLIGAVLIEIIGVILFLAKGGLKYLPDIVSHKEKEDTIVFMEEFILSGSSATILTNRASWLTSNDALILKLNKKIAEGVKIEIITSKELPETFKSKLFGANYFVTNEENIPETRFTLINASRNGSEKLAIARGTHPDHEITIFDSKTGPQIIAMAKDIIKKSKSLANAK